MTSVIYPTWDGFLTCVAVGYINGSRPCLIAFSFEANNYTFWPSQREHNRILEILQNIGNMHTKLFGLFALSTAVNFATADDWITFHKNAGCGGGRQGHSDYSVKNHGCFSNSGQSANLHGSTSYCQVTLGVYSDGACNNKVNEVHLRMEGQIENEPCAGLSSLPNNYKVIQSNC
jgi:hypothetical protein